MSEAVNRTETLKVVTPLAIDQPARTESIGFPVAMSETRTRVEQFLRDSTALSETIHVEATPTSSITTQFKDIGSQGASGVGDAYTVSEAATIAWFLYDLSSTITVTVTTTFNRHDDVGGGDTNFVSTSSHPVYIGLKSVRDILSVPLVTAITNQNTLKVGTSAAAFSYDQSDIQGSVIGPTLGSNGSQTFTTPTSSNNTITITSAAIYPPTPASGSTTTVTNINEASILSFCRGLSPSTLTLTWTKDGGGTDTIKQRLTMTFLITITGDNVAADKVVNVGLNDIATNLAGSFGATYTINPNIATYAALGTSQTAPALTDTILNAETGTRINLSKTTGQIIQSSPPNLYYVGLSGQWTAAAINANVGESGLFSANVAGDMFQHITYSPTLPDTSSVFGVVDSRIKVTG